MRDRIHIYIAVAVVLGGTTLIDYTFFLYTINFLYSSPRNECMGVLESIILSYSDPVFYILDCSKISILLVDPLQDCQPFN